MRIVVWIHTAWQEAMNKTHTGRGQCHTLAMPNHHCITTIAIKICLNKKHTHLIHLEGIIIEVDTC